MRRTIIPSGIFLSLGIILSTTPKSGTLNPEKESAEALAGLPTLADPEKFRVEPFADLAGHPNNWAFQLTLTEGENGFPAGLYITGGPSFQSDDDPRILFRVDAGGEVHVVENRFTNGVENLVFTKGAYGDGMLLTEPQSLKISRLRSDGSLTTFATLGTAPFGPAGMTYGSDGLIYVSDFTSGKLLRLYPNGTTEEFTTIVLASAPVSWMKPCLYDPSSRYGGGFIVATFSSRVDDFEPHGLDSLYSVSTDGRKVEKLAGGFTGIGFLTLGPGGDFGKNLYIASQGSRKYADGGIYTMTPLGDVAPFMTGIDGVHVVFDTTGVLGGGMFVADMVNWVEGPRNPSSKIWRVVPIADTGPALPAVSRKNCWKVKIVALVLLVLLGLILVAFQRRKKRKS